MRFATPPFGMNRNQIMDKTENSDEHGDRCGVPEMVAPFCIPGSLYTLVSVMFCFH